MKILKTLSPIVILCIAFFALNLPNAKAQDASDIWVGKLQLDQKQAISDLVRITDTSEYTNQPYFFDNSRLFFTQAFDEKSEDGSETISQMDIMRFNLLTGELNNVTQSPMSEYSATPLPNKPGFSVIRVNMDGLQELWEFNNLGAPQKNLLPQAEPVGYQVWLNNSELLLFILGEPHTLQRFNTSTPQEVGVIENNNIGASLYRFKDSDWYLYTRSESGDFLYAYNAKTRKSQELLKMPKNTPYFSLSPNGDLFTSDGETFWHLALTESDEGIKPLQSFKALPIKHKHCGAGVSRTAVSPDMTMIALVCPRGDE